MINHILLLENNAIYYNDENQGKSMHMIHRAKYNVTMFVKIWLDLLYITSSPFLPPTRSTHTQTNNNLWKTLDALTSWAGPFKTSPDLKPNLIRQLPLPTDN